MSKDFRRKVQNKKINERNKRNYGGMGNKREIFKELCKRDGYRCKMCKRSGADEKLTIDHIVQIRDGGSHDLTNLQLLCQPCHSIKDNPSHSKGYKLFEIAFEKAGINIKKK